MDEKQVNELRRLWAEAFLRLQEMGKIFIQETKTETLREKLGAGGKTEVTAIIQRKDGSIRRIQEYKFKGEKDKGGKPVMVLKKKETKDFPKGVMKNG